GAGGGGGLSVGGRGGGRGGQPHVRQELAERLALLRRDDEVARVAAEHLLAAPARGPLAGVVEQQDPALAVVDADQRLGRLGEDPGERLVEDERVHGATVTAGGGGGGPPPPRRSRVGVGKRNVRGLP